MITGSDDEGGGYMDSKQYPGAGQSYPDDNAMDYGQYANEQPVDEQYIEEQGVEEGDAFDPEAFFSDAFHQNAGNPSDVANSGRGGGGGDMEGEGGIATDLQLSDSEDDEEDDFEEVKQQDDESFDMGEFLQQNPS